MRSACPYFQKYSSGAFRGELILLSSPVDSPNAPNCYVLVISTENVTLSPLYEEITKYTTRESVV